MTVSFQSGQEYIGRLLREGRQSYGSRRKHLSLAEEILELVLQATTQLSFAYYMRDHLRGIVSRLFLSRCRQHYSRSGHCYLANNVFLPYMHTQYIQLF